MNSSVWAVWAAQDSKEKTWIRVFLSNFGGRFFQLFVVKKKFKFVWKYCSVSTKGFHKEKFKEFFKNS